MIWIGSDPNWNLSGGKSFGWEVMRIGTDNIPLIYLSTKRLNKNLHLHYHHRHF